MKIFLTGGTGFIGHFVAKEFLERGHSLRIFARNPQKIPSLAKQPRVEIIEGSLCDKAVIEKGLVATDACVHIALGWGDTPVEMLQNDTLATVTILELAEQAGCKKFIYTSSTAAAGKIRSNMDETMINLPQDLYGATKSASEAFVLGYRAKMQRNIIRPGYTFGNPAFADGVSQPDKRFANIAKAVLANEAVHLTKHDGTQFIHASQLAKIYAAVLDSNCNEEIFYGLGTEWISWKTIAEKAISMHPASKSTIQEQDKGWGKDPCKFSLEKIKRFFGLEFNGMDFIDEHVRWNFLYSAHG